MVHIPNDRSNECANGEHGSSEEDDLRESTSGVGGGLALIAGVAHSLLGAVESL